MRYVLKDKDWKALVATLDNPPPANDALKAAMRRKPIWKK